MSEMFGAPVPAGAMRPAHPRNRVVYGRVKPHGWEHSYTYRNPNDPWDNAPIDSTPAILKPNDSFINVFGTFLFEPRDEFYERALCTKQDATNYEEVNCRHYYQKPVYNRLLKYIEDRLSSHEAFMAMSKQRMRVIHHRLIRLLQKKDKQIIYDLEVLLYRQGKLYAKHMRIRCDGHGIIFAKVVGSVPQNDVSLMSMGGKTLDDVGYVSIYPDIHTPVNPKAYYRNDNYEAMYIPKDAEAQVRKFLNRNRNVVNNL